MTIERLGPSWPGLMLICGGDREGGAFRDTP